MNLRRLNWQIWAAFLLSLLAFLSYFFVFVNFPVTRDFPWANLLLFAAAIVLLLLGLRRAFASDRGKWSKILGSVLAVLSVAILGFFIFAVFVMARQLPASAGAPHVGQKAPDFRLTDSSGKSVALSELLSTPVNGKAPKGVLLIFYRGYW
jgi:membrane protease YdiL (CAAX protease family)